MLFFFIVGLNTAGFLKVIRSAPEESRAIFEVGTREMITSTKLRALFAYTYSDPERHSMHEKELAAEQSWRKFLLAVGRKYSLAIVYNETYSTTRFLWNLGGLGTKNF